MPLRMLCYHVHKDSWKYIFGKVSVNDKNKRIKWSLLFSLVICWWFSILLRNTCQNFFWMISIYLTWKIKISDFDSLSACELTSFLCCTSSFHVMSLTSGFDSCPFSYFLFPALFFPFCFLSLSCHWFINNIGSSGKDKAYLGLVP